MLGRGAAQRGEEAEGSGEMVGGGRASMGMNRTGRNKAEIAIHRTKGLS